MKTIAKLFLTIAFGALLTACSEKVDDSNLMKELQEHINDVMSQGYRIDRVTIDSKRYSDEGPSYVGDFRFMFIKAVSPDPTIKYMASFGYSGNELKFYGYPVDSYNKVKAGMTYLSKPNLPNAIAKLDEIKKMIPNGFKYAHLLTLEYAYDTDGAFYTFKVEVKPTSDDLTHANVKQEKKSYVQHITHTRRKSGARGYSETKRESKVEHTMTFRLRNNQLDIK